MGRINVEYPGYGGSHQKKPQASARGFSSLVVLVLISRWTLDCVSHLDMARVGALAGHRTSECVAGHAVCEGANLADGVTQGRKALNPVPDHAGKSEVGSSQGTWL